MAAPAISQLPADQPSKCDATVLLDAVQACLHTKASEWIFLRELRVGTGFHSSAAQRLDGFALNCFAHTAMKRICYEIKISRADFLAELKHPLKRRIGLRYSNEFYFVTPAGLLKHSELPIECGLIEASPLRGDGEVVLSPEIPLAHFDPTHQLFLRVVVPAPWRDTPGPTWQFVAGMLRNQQRQWQVRPHNSQQQKLPFAD